MTAPTRAERVAAVMALRAEGLTYKQIADRLGISTSYACDLVADPDGADADRRRSRMRGVCETCGAPTAWRRGGAPARHCQACYPDARRVWTRERVIDAIRDWADTYGIQPSAKDWNVSLCGSEGRDRFYGDGCWPHVSTVQRLFGSWSEAIRAAGYTAPTPGRRRRREVPS